VQRYLKVDKVDFLLAFPSDIIRFIETHQDVNPNFPPAAGRTPLARVRTYLAEYRTLLAWYRTFLAKGRTGLAFMRTGFSFISIALVLIRIFGIGYLTVFEALILFAGATMAVDGFMWYLPTRKIIKKRLHYAPTEPTFGSTFLELANGGLYPTFNRVGPINGAEALRSRWNRLTPVMRRRFFAIDRTDLADERTILGYYRTIMAQARTGLAFTRTGVGFVGLGTALLRQYSLGWWTFFDAALLFVGAAMMIEGFHWYIPGRRASQKSDESVHRMRIKTSVRDFMFPPVYRSPSGDDLPSSFFTGDSHAPGIWGTTGLALERTLLADRRNVKARLRTIMARSRTGLAFIRTGTSVFTVGLGLLVYFGVANLFFAIFNIILVLAGLALIADGYYWHLPAERMKKEFPYCFNEMEIAFPNYARPSFTWKKVVFRP
jgi:uncharacterized membrane protein YidH (DUF202 family)